MKRLVVDLDGTLTKDTKDEYVDAKPRLDVVRRLQEYKKNGFLITIATARNMRKYEGNIGKINIHTLPVIVSWLEKYGVPYDEILVGKPWCGTEGFYIDDKSIRPSEFSKMSYEEIVALLDEESKC